MEETKQEIVNEIHNDLYFAWDWIDTGEKETSVGLKEYIYEGGELDADENEIIFGGTTDYFDEKDWACTEGKVEYIKQNYDINDYNFFSTGSDSYECHIEI